MTIKELLALCRDNGYEGDTSRASVKGWMAGDDCPLELRDTKNRPLSFDDLWPEKIVHKGITISVAKNEAEPDSVEVVEDTPAEEPATEAPVEEASAAPKTRTVDHDANKARGIAGQLASGKAFGIGRPEVSAYKHRISRRNGGGFKHISERAVFDDVSKAEVAGATLRLAIAKSHGLSDYSQKANDESIVGKGASTLNNGVGGALTTTDFIPELIVLLNEYGAARQLTQFRTVSREVCELPRRTADPTVSWSDEAGGFSDQDPAYDNVQVIAKKLMGGMYVSSELLNDSAISVVDDLFNGFANGIANKEDAAYFLGDGTSTYGGVTGLLNALGSAGTVTAASGSDTWPEIIDAELQEMLGLLPSYAHMGGGIKITCTTGAFYNTFNRLAHAAGGITYRESQAGVVTPAYNGIPIVFNNSTQATTAADTVFAFCGNFDMAAKATEVSGSLEFATSEHYRFANDQLTLRARERVGITVHDAGDSSNAGPVVGIKTNS